MKQELKRFEATSDSGIVYTIVEFVEIIRYPTHAHGTGVHKGTRDYSLLDGRAVIQIDADTFQIVDTDETIRKRS